MTPLWRMLLLLLTVMKVLLKKMAAFRFSSAGVVSAVQLLPSEETRSTSTSTVASTLSMPVANQTPLP